MSIETQPAETLAPATAPNAERTTSPGSEPAMSAAEVASWATRMATGGDLEPLAAATPAELCDVLTQLEVLKNASAAAQARVTLLAHAALRDQALADGVPREKADKGIAQQLAMARRESPHAGSRHVGFATAIVTEMPATHAALTAGLIGEWTATQLVKETACLSVEHRGLVDAHLAGRFGGESHRALVAAAKAKAYELDPYSVTNRGRKARSDRRVSMRPAPDVMAIVSGYLPVADGVACYKALDQAAKSLKAQGDERSLDQLRADLFAERLTGRAPADGQHVEVGLVITDKALVGLDETPARLEGYGPIPAPMARDLLHPDGTSAAPSSDRPDEADDTQAVQDPALTDRPGSDPPDSTEERARREAVIWVRRLYADQETGVLINQDDRRRTFTGALRRFVVARDQVCRTPWCDAPVRHADHVLAFARGGRTSKVNANGLCEACNYGKEADGLSHDVVDLADGTHTVKITTQTGHTYYSKPPPVLPTLGCSGEQSVPEPTSRSVGGLPQESVAEPPPRSAREVPPGSASQAGRSCAMRRANQQTTVTIRLSAPAGELVRGARASSTRPPGSKRTLIRAGIWRQGSNSARDGSGHGSGASSGVNSGHAQDAADGSSPLETFLASLLSEAA